MKLDRDEIVDLTADYGGEWGLRHTERLLRLVELIDGDREYDREVVWLAAHLHDWGGYQHWAVAGVDHAERSVEVAAGFLQERGFPEDRLTLVLDAIGAHHSGGQGHPLETALLSDADMLDLLGAIGVLRTFSMVPRDLGRAYATVQERKRQLPALLCLDESRALAESRLLEMDALLTSFEHDSFGLF